MDVPWDVLYVRHDFMYDLIELTGLSIFREILISLWSLWSFKSVDISEEMNKKNIMMKMTELFIF